MSVQRSGAPNFTISGDPAAIDGRVGTMRERATQYDTISNSVSRISAEGWQGKAADRFRERFELEPGRWGQAGTGFRTAADALSNYASALRTAQSKADWCRGEYARGQEVTTNAKSAYDAEVADGKREKATWEAAHGAGTFTLTIVPFTDPGAAIRDNAVSEFEKACTDLQTSADAAAVSVRAGCEGAPASRNWFETGLAFIGGVLSGAFEAVVDLVALGFNLTFGPWIELARVATGDLTLEELMAKKALSWETVQGLWTALITDPLGFGKEIGKALLDWDTWKDDPARALGHLVPDAIVAVCTMGTGAAATRGASSLAKLGTKADDVAAAATKLGDLAAVANRTDDIADALGAARRGSKADDFAGLSDELKAVAKHLDQDGFTPGVRPTDWTNAPRPPAGAQRNPITDPDVLPYVDDMAKFDPSISKRGIHGAYDYSTSNGYHALNPMMRGKSPVTPDLQYRQANVERAISELPSQTGTTFRGTNLPPEVYKGLTDGGTYVDKAFMSTSGRQSVAQGFIRPGDNPVLFKIDGQSGVDISRLSAARSESEILFNGGTSFRIDGQPTMIKLGGRDVLQVNLVEVVP